ncbi:MAG: hypothetical protein ACTSQY_11105 [Candidatus Odinarchaeia archaeon]
MSNREKLMQCILFLLIIIFMFATRFSVYDLEDRIKILEKKQKQTVEIIVEREWGKGYTVKGVKIND